MKKFITLFFLILLTACVSKPLTQFNCDIPEGINYECYSDEECSEYFKGYWRLLKQMESISLVLEMGAERTFFRCNMGLKIV
jgi:hypothetical protein